MIRIIPYDDSQDEAIRRISPRKLHEMKHHGDVLSDSRCLAVDQEEVLGLGYLVCDESFRLLPEEEHGDCFLAVEYQAKDADPTREIEASALLLSTLMNYFDALCGKMPEKSLVLRTWCGTKKLDYMAFLQSFGFTKADAMLVYTSDLQDTVTDSMVDFPGLQITFAENKLETSEEQEIYLTARGQAFGTHESGSDLAYRLSDPNTRIFTASDKGRIIAGITTWRVGDTVSEEGIFCIPEFRRRGIGESLVHFAHSALLKDGISQVVLTVYQENQSAIHFYEKLGYQLRSIQTELHYQPEFAE